MTLYRKIDVESGLFIEDVILKEPPSNGTEYILEGVPEGLYHPKWTGEKWIEGLTDKEITELTNHQTQKPTQTELLMLAIAELDFQREIDKTEQQLALAEIAELILGGN